VSGVDLTGTLGGLTLRNPVMSAAGCAGTGRELSRFTEPSRLGAFVTRTITLDPRAGRPGPRVLETPSGLLWSVGRQNPGLQGFLATELPWLAQRDVRTIVSVAATTLGEYGELARRLGSSPGVSGVEVDLAGVDSFQAGKVVHVLRRDLPRGVPVLAKLGGGAVVEAARAVAENGADAVVLVHGFAAMAIDGRTLAPALADVQGTLSGPAVHALALRCVWDVHAALPDLPVVGAGGIRTGFDAFAMLLAGASAVQVGTVLLHDPSAPARILAELDAELAGRGITGVAEVVGRAHHHEGAPS
jgi:dihydroorotate dehydrogenase (NAD+) catalytic subunit